MNRPIVALVPVRGAHWSGLDAVTVGRFFLDDGGVLSLAVRLRLVASGDRWVPGDALPARSGLFVDTVPTYDDAIPTKNEADVMIDDGGFPSLRDRELALHCGDRRFVLDGRAPETPRPALSDFGSFRLDRDIDALQRAREDQRVDSIDDDETIGWAIDRAIAVEGQLGFAVRARADLADGTRVPIDLDIDTILVHLAKRELSLTYRGLLIDASFGVGLDRIVIGVVPPDQTEEELAELFDAGLPLAHFAHPANVEESITGTRPPPVGEEGLAMARMTAWESGPGEPTLSPDEYREVRAELERRPRAEALALQGFDEISWGREEWAVAEKLGQASADTSSVIDDPAGEHALHPELTSWVDAMKPSGPPARPLDLDAFARVSAHLEVRDPAKVLGEAQLTITELVRIDAMMAEHLDAHPEAATELEGLLDKYRPEARRAADAESFGIEEDV